MRYDWDHFFTGTFAFPCDANLALRRFGAFANSFTAEVQGPIPYFVAAEPTLADQFHVHALIRGTQSISPARLEARWKRRNGLAKVLGYERHGAMTSYVTKGITERRSDWDLSPGFNRAMAKLDRGVGRCT